MSIQAGETHHTGEVRVPQGRLHQGTVTSMRYMLERIKSQVKVPKGTVSLTLSAPCDL